MSFEKSRKNFKNLKMVSRGVNMVILTLLIGKHFICRIKIIISTKKTTLTTQIKNNK